MRKKIEKVTWQHRFDFSAILECEHCGHKQELKSGYDDEYYHSKVLPSITCESCKKDRQGNITNQNSQGTVSV